MQIYEPHKGLKRCVCGNKPKTITIGYGSTPYDVFCKKCFRQCNRFINVGGPLVNMVKVWNIQADLWPGEVHEALQDYQEPGRYNQTNYYDEYDHRMFLRAIRAYKARKKKK